MKYPELLSELLALKHSRPHIIAIDGPAGAGKTTLAMKLSKDLLGAQVIHMDDLYEGWKDPLSTRLKMVAISQILTPYINNLPVTYQKFDWNLNKFIEKKFINPSKFLILEGVGSGQQDFSEFLSKLIWIQIDPQVGFNRVITRDGEHVRDEMLKFLIDQNNHFVQELTEKRADYSLNGAF